MRLPNIIILACTLGSVGAFGSWPPPSTVRGCDPKNGVAFQVSTDHKGYAAGDSMQVELLVINTGHDPLHFSRHLTDCGSRLGFASIEIIDRSSRNVRRTGCSHDTGPFQDNKLLETVNDPEHWVVLRPSEIYGQELALETPHTSGTYRLTAELFPTSFTSAQLKLLELNHIRIMSASCPALPITLTVN
jgi:hypothetical protein